MKESGCSSRSGQLAMDALGRLDEAEHAELEAHLAYCEECRATRAELRSTVDALDTMTMHSTSAPVAEVSPQLADAVLAGLRPEDGGGDRGRRIRRGAVICGSMAAVAVTAVLVSVGMHHSDVPTKTVALRGVPGVSASAVLVEKSWGTSLTIEERGLTPGQTYTVSMANEQGRWWTAGSYRTTGSGSVEATMACAAQFDSIEVIKVTDPSGRAVLSSDLKASY